MHNIAPRLITAPATRLLSLAEVKAHCRVDHADDDAYMAGLVLAAEGHLDGYSGVLGRALISQTWQQPYEVFAPVLDIPFGPVISVTSLSYRDVNRVTQTVPSNQYRHYTRHTGDCLAMLSNFTHPASLDDEDDAVMVTWVAGYGAAAADVPAPIRHAALLLVAYWYSVREAVNIGNIVSELPFAVNALLAPYRRVSI
jgi:uncharacterized phiE125 gp8 family phage protein